VGTSDPVVENSTSLIFYTGNPKKGPVPGARLSGSDPAVKAGRLAVELHPWMTAKGMIRNH
jgi:hypothetical protein